MRKCLAISDTIDPKENDKDTIVVAPNDEMPEKPYTGFMTKEGYIKLSPKSEAERIESYTIRKSTGRPIIRDPKLIEIFNEGAIAGVIHNFTFQKSFIVDRLRDKLKISNFAPGSQYLNASELKQIKDGHCACEKLKVKEITSAAQKAKKEITNNESIKVLEPNEQPRVSTEDDLACEFVGA